MHDALVSRVVPVVIVERPGISGELRFRKIDDEPVLTGRSPDLAWFRSQQWSIRKL